MYSKANRLSRFRDLEDSVVERMVPFMPDPRATDKERAFFAIFSTMIGATALSRILPAQARARVLASARDLLSRSF
jgi:TetR/AcrR family transcriptional regulator, transcriptional repressor for nem operon